MARRDNPITSEYLKAIRDELRMDQQEFAEALCISRSTLYNIENGRVEPTVHHFKAAATFLNIPFFYLCYLEYLDKTFIYLSEYKKNYEEFISSQKGISGDQV